MDIRAALPGNYILRFRNNSGGELEYTIEKELGRGNTCIVHEAFYTANSGDKKQVRIKECYPVGKKIVRLDSGELCDEDPDIFNAFKDKMTKDFKLENDLFYSDGLTDLLVNTFDIYYANNTVYVVSAYLKDSVLSEYKPNSLKSCVNIIKNAALAVGKIHERGYLYLDIKPENITVVDSVSERILLFDVDSLIHISDAKNISSIAYSRDYAAPEQRAGNMNNLGYHTDVYGVGAVLFSLIFGRAPQARDCESGAEFGFSEIIYPGNYRDKLYFILRDFFRKTLANYRLDRFRNMDETAKALAELESLADITQPYIISTKINRPAFFAGREREMAALYEEYCNSDRNFIFIAGMGGIGKTSLIKEFIFHHRGEFDAVLYLNYDGSIRRLIADDSAVRLNTVSKIPEESEEEYYSRKLKAIKEITAKQNVLAVFDNYNDLSDPGFKEILGVFGKVIFVTRNDVGALNYPCLKLCEIDDRAVLYAVFEHNLRRGLTRADIKYLDNIIEKSAANTLILELIAKQIACSFLSVKQASALIDKHGFSQIAPEKIEFARDDIYFYGTMRRILSEIFAVNKLSEENTVLLKIISIFNSDGIDAKLLQELCEFSSLNGVNSLISGGWVNAENGAVYLHPVIGEMMNAMDISEKYVVMLDKVSENLCGEFTREIDFEFSRYLLVLTDRILGEYARDTRLCGKSYARLCHTLIMNAPIDHEDKILETAEYLIDKTEYLTPLEIMDMYAVIIDMHEAYVDFERAETALERARKFAENSNDDFIRAQYFDLLADFYNKRYEKGDVKRSLKCCDNAMRFARHSNNKQAKELLASAALFKAAVMMRNGLGKRSELISLLKLDGEICSETDDKLTQINYELHMTRAWFYVFTKDKKWLNRCLHGAYKIAKRIYPSDLGTIVHIILPAARMYCNIFDTETAVKLLNCGIEICLRHEEAPYKRQQRELEKKLREIAE
ncbi:MAG: NB-ARC domain-containing protein [Ruminococcus sp.]|nr:NB-ARC domain-containing protein [Ruminococcus sp.]